jgi:hypothetical protein
MPAVAGNGASVTLLGRGELAGTCSSCPPSTWESRADQAPGGSGLPSGGAFDDLRDLAAVDVECPGDGSPPMSRVVPSSYRLLQAWTIRRIVPQSRRRNAHESGPVSAWLRGRCPVLTNVIRSSKEPASASAGRALTSAPNRAVAHAVRQVGTDSSEDARAQAPPSQGWHGMSTPVRVQDQHACRQDEPVHGERDEPCGHARLAVSTHQLEGALI